MLQLITAQPSRHPSPTVKVQRLAYLVFQRPERDRERCIRFLTDFGLEVAHQTTATAFFRSKDGSPFCYRVDWGDKPRFIGLAFEVDEVKDLVLLTKVAGASKVEDIDAPGGGQVVGLIDPSGFRIEVVANQRRSPPLAHRAPLSLNLGGGRDRINATQRPPLTPPELLRLGHVVLEVANYQATCAWYTQHLGLIPSDVQLLPDGSPAVSFLRMDLGSRATDHHTVALAQGFMPLYSHSAFEVTDPDAIGMGQRVLEERGWRHAWGIGRHILGSQIFDYWEDPWSDKHEHYCDGDLCTADAATGFHAASRPAMSQWGKPMPASFSRPKMNLAKIAGLWRSLRHSPDLSIRKLITLARLFG